VGGLLSVLVDSPLVAAALREVRADGRVREVAGVVFKGHATPFCCRIFAAGEECGVSVIPEVDGTGAIALEELRHSQDRLRRSEELYRAFIENSSEGIWRFETDRAIPVNAPVDEQLDQIMTHAYIAECNETLARFYGLPSASDLLHLRINGVVQLKEGLLKGYIKEFIVAGYRLNNIEVARRGPDGDTRILLYSFSGTIEHGALVRVWGVVRDVTERREAERRLRLLAHTLTSTRDAVSITDMDNHVLFVNDAFLRQYGYPEEKLIGKDIAFVRAASTTKQLEEQIHSGTVQGEWNGEVINRRADGSEFPVELWTSVVRNDEGEPVAMVGVARDITERKRTEERIRASLREKEVLLKEIHHRVKNNLQVISSLLSLQAEYLKDESMLKIMRESQNRVKSMALVHEKLYQSQNLASIEFGEYVRELVTQLSRSYGINPDLIRLNISTDAIDLAVDRAIPCGIIVNELVTNALKYAFPGGRHGTIDVLLHNLADGKIRLVIRDDGVGLPRDLELHNASSLGLTLVYMLADQVQGELAISRDGAGTEFSLTFRK
jgi:PAS domain S-box-containing protein